MPDAPAISRPTYAKATVGRPDVDWLSETCSQLKYGECRTRRCLLRGGYSGTGGFDPKIATCEEKELLTYIGRLEAVVKAARAAKPFPSTSRWFALSRALAALGDGDG